jgi:hypothetical protein
MPASEVFASGLPIHFSPLSFFAVVGEGRAALCQRLLALLLSAKNTWLRIDGSMQRLVGEQAFRLNITRIVTGAEVAFIAPMSTNSNSASLRFRTMS